MVFLPPRPDGTRQKVLGNIEAGTNQESRASTLLGIRNAVAAGRKSAKAGSSCKSACPSCLNSTRLPHARQTRKARGLARRRSAAHCLECLRRARRRAVTGGHCVGRKGTRSRAGSSVQAALVRSKGGQNRKTRMICTSLGATIVTGTVLAAGNEQAKKEESICLSVPKQVLASSTGGKKRR